MSGGRAARAFGSDAVLAPLVALEHEIRPGRSLGFAQNDLRHGITVHVEDRHRPVAERPMNVSLWRAPSDELPSRATELRDDVAQVRRSDGVAARGRREVAKAIRDFLTLRGDAFRIHYVADHGWKEPFEARALTRGRDPLRRRRR